MCSGACLSAPQAQGVVGFGLKSQLNLIVLFNPVRPQSLFKFLLTELTVDHRKSGQAIIWGMTG